MMKKGKIDGKMVEIVTLEQYFANPSLYPNNYTAIDGGNGYVYPMRGKMDGRPGIYINPKSPLIRQKDPTEENAADYSVDNIVNFEDAKTMSDIIHAENILKDQERSILTLADNIFMPPIKESDSSEMVGIKSAVRAKNCDVDKYEHRIGTKNFQNWKRLFDRPSMTLSKIRETCEALDIKASLTFEDINADVPNPMNQVIEVQITHIEDDNNNEEE